MTIQSDLTPMVYMDALKGEMGSFIEFGQERFTGYFLGRFFYVTHHAGYEWNRRITNQKNAALGYVRKAEDGSQVRFLRFKGILCPGQFLFTYFLLILIFAVAMTFEGVWMGEAFLLLLAIGLATMLIIALPATFFESLTERSKEGENCLLTLLIDPSDPFSYTHHQNEFP